MDATCGVSGKEDPQPSVATRGAGEYGCPHYRRRVKLVTPCCDRVFWCRHCHNEEMEENNPDVKTRHRLDRSLVTEVVCALCAKRQPVGERCVGCGVSFGVYACTRCPFYVDDMSKQPFHCDGCGLCRVGGRENYFHCERCGSCYAHSLRGRHRCVERSMHQNCPICFEYLFESTSPATVLPCGHTLHAACLDDLARSGTGVCTSCPICLRSIADESAAWRAIDAVAAAAPLPPEYRGWTVDLLCNDCTHSGTVPFNLVALRCGACGSYNTRQIGLHRPEPGEASEPEEGSEREEASEGEEALEEEADEEEADDDGNGSGRQ